jgi:DNA-binding transcriptional regulator YdaS (Cro superfamily)
MTTNQFRRALTMLGVTQVGLAKALKVDERTVRNWVGGRSKVPPLIVILVNLMLDGKITLEDIRA